MALSNQQINGAASGEARTVQLNGERPKEEDASILQEKGVTVAEEGNPSCENEGIEEKIPNGGILKRYDHEDISNSVDSPANSISDDLGDYNFRSLPYTNGDSNSVSTLTENEAQKMEETSLVGENQSPSTGESDNDSPSQFVPDCKVNSDISVMIRPHSRLPKPEAPPGVCTPQDLPAMDRSQSLPESFDMPAIGKFILEKGNSWSSAFVNRISSLKENRTNNTLVSDDDEKLKSNVTEFTLSDLKVIVKLKNASEKDDKGKSHLELRGRITFFSRSNCRDCTAVRCFFREKKLRYVEINIDVFPMREKELIARTGSSAVPQIFFNEKFFGGLVALNSLRNSGLLDQKLKDMLSAKCPDDAPALPVYGFDDPEEELADEMVKVVRVLRQKLPIQDRLMKMKIVKNCFSGAEMVEVLIQHLDCGRKKAVEIGKKIARKHFIHHVFGENDFEDGNHFYRFLEHEPFIPKCFNFRGSTNDIEPKPAAVISQRLAKLMAAVLEAYASDDRQRLNYVAISSSEEFRRYLNMMPDLQRMNILELSSDEKLAFFLNLFNAMVIHAVIRVGHPGGLVDRRSFYSDFLYLVGGHPYSLTVIKNGILRNNRRAPYSLLKPFGDKDKRLELAFPKVNPLIHFGLANGTRSSPSLRFFTPQAVESELRNAAREFFQRNGMDVDLAKRTVHVTRILKWFDVDFGTEKEVLKWIMNYLDATKAGLLTHLLGDGGPVNIVYQNYDWSVNS